jgi:prepilin-type N-terminal cleavage/methylation domain-containing protein
MLTRSASIGSRVVLQSIVGLRRALVTRRRGSLRGTHGFTLLEALIAIVVLALSLSVLMPSHSSGVRALAAVDEHLGARLLAQSLMAEWPQGRMVRSGTTQGSFNMFRWVQSVAPLEDVQPRGSQADGWVLYRVVLVVSWGKNRRIELQTLRLGLPR